MRKNLFQWHPFGQRIIKTSIAVMLCLFCYMLRGYSGETMPAEAAITAIICMQPYVYDTTQNALNRIEGTMIGACCGFLFLLIMMLFPAIGRHRVILYPLMGVGTLIALHSSVLLHRADASGLAAIVFVCVVIAYPDIENPLYQAFHRILDVLLGTAIATVVNALRIPRKKMHHRVFFLSLEDLTTDRNERLSPAALFRLHNLFREGANICLISKHAPTFQTSQLDEMSITTPMIVMDGAGLFDPRENVYLSTSNMNPTSCRWLMKRLEDVSYFIYTVHRDRNCIYHHGAMTQREQTVYQYLKRSPYRYYLDDDHLSVSDVVYIKIVTGEDEANRLQRELEPQLEKMKLRSVIRPQAGLDDGCALYFYAIHADVQHATEHVMHLLQQRNPRFEKWEVRIDRPVTTVRGTIRLLKKVKNEYEPMIGSTWLAGLVQKARAKGQP